MKLLNNLVDYYHAQPARVIGYGTAAIVFLASQLHIVLDPATVTQYLLIGVPLVLGVEKTRAKVTPWNAPVDDEPA